MQILAALAVFLIGRWIVRHVVNFVDRSFQKTKLDRTLSDFVENIIYVTGMVLVIVAALGQLGVQTTSFAAAIAAAGLAIGLALQGSLSNFAAGFLIIFFRPFKAGDYVEVAGEGGTVEEISIFTTRLVTPDNREITVPNNNITTDTIVNYSAKNKRRIDLVVGVAYDADLKKTQKLLMGILEKHDNVLKDPAPVVEVNELGASSVDFIVRPWVKTDVFWPTRWDLLQTIKTELDKAGIGIPFPQRDVHLFIEDGQLAANTNKTKRTKKAA
jgi:small conductance mechanosensitive channel